VGRDLAAVLSGPVLPAARALLGCVLRANGVAVRLSEVEAYHGMGQDEASHAHRGRTPRNTIMFGPAGFAYLYFTYGMHWCMNVVTEEEGHASAVLLRALEPVAHLEGRTQGPALLCKAMGIDGRLTGHDLVSDSLHIDDPRDERTIRVVKRPRIGVDYAGHWAKRLLRFYIAGNPFISRK